MIRPRWIFAGVVLAALVGRPAWAGLTAGSLDTSAADAFDASLTGVNNGPNAGTGSEPGSTTVSNLELHLQADDSTMSGSSEAIGSDKTAVIAAVPEPGAILFGAVVSFLLGIGLGGRQLFTKQSRR
jgi:hypothetical protein